MSHSGILNRHFSNPKYVRMFGHTVTLTIHALNAVHLLYAFKDEVLKDSEVAYFWKYKFTLITIWNAYTQIIYATLGLSCDLLSLSNESKDSSLLRTLRSLRDLLFSAIVFPITLGVCSVFWSLYSYNPNFVVALKLDKIMPRISNHVLHTFIVPVVLWEVVYRPRKTPASHLLNLAVLNAYHVTFVVVLFQTLYESGQFVYPLLNMLKGTPYLYLLLLSCFIINNLSYYIQWYITDFIWGRVKEEIKKES